MATLTKHELAEVISERMGYSKRVSLALVDGILEYMKTSLKDGKKVKIVRFGTLQVVQRKARKGTSLKDGSPIQIPAKTTVSFRPSRTLKGVINAGASEEVLPNRRGK